MTFGSVLALFGTMLVLALIPGVSVWAVSARSAAYGFAHGVAVTLGILLGDVFFIVLAIYGLVFLAEMMGSFFVLIKYLGSAYLIWLGVALLRSRSQVTKSEEISKSTILSSFLIGLFITLGDQKAVLFYLGFLPAFVDLQAVSFGDVTMIVAIATLALGIAKLGYAYLAHRGSLLFKRSGANRSVKVAAGLIMIGVGVFMAVSAWD
ncbi:LysE family translocator [Rubellicoccus peritrichatus]|uniref:LysE family translocator n=1 Tax=Rubellicoccus peritrichatus TaxID=3080537 RepID=A0AAQ3QUJ1_9BACT|nr:LysE family translocator [Puniceicoccus sp. CR14]WOO42451.1 LysE family translocator [Puniceicoccus sp. CR14]